MEGLGSLEGGPTSEVSRQNGDIATARQELGLESKDFSPIVFDAYHCETPLRSLLKCTIKASGCGLAIIGKFSIGIVVVDNEPEQALEVEVLFTPQGAVIVENCNALRRRYIIG